MAAKETPEEIVNITAVSFRMGHSFSNSYLP